MNNNIKVSVNDGVTWSTDSPLKAFAYLTAIEFYGSDSDLAIKVANLCHDVYVSENKPLNAIDVIDYICENYHDLPDDFNDLCDVVYNGISQYDL
jgi:hypothetical protein